MSSAHPGLASQLAIEHLQLPALVSEGTATSPPPGACPPRTTKDVMVALHVEFGPARAQFVHAYLGLSCGTSINLAEDEVAIEDDGVFAHPNVIVGLSDPA
jgi:hypothetical protein